MFFNDPISDMLTRIRNGVGARKTSLTMPHSKMCEQVANILAANGFLHDIKVAEVAGFKSLELTLPVESDKITAIERISKPGRRIYVACDKIPSVLSGRGIVVVSTSKGVMSGREARKAGLGGELICRVW